MAINQRSANKASDSELGRGTVDGDRELNRNPDAITGAPGSHPVGTGVGAAGGGAAGAAAGAAIGSVVPGIGTAIGGVVGAVIGATGGGLVGKGIAENINPTAEDAYWRENYKTRPYASGASYDQFAPAYRYGWESRSRYSGRKFDDVENDLAHGWNNSSSGSDLGWEKARFATRDAWERVDRATVASDRARV